MNGTNGFLREVNGTHDETYVEVGDQGLGTQRLKFLTMALIIDPRWKCKRIIVFKSKLGIWWKRE